MSKNLIYCFSGTGNSLDLAKNIARALGDTEIRLIRSTPLNTDTEGAERVGFIFPCFGGGLPGGLEEAFAKVEIAPGTYTFGIVTYAAYPGCGLHKLNAIHKLDYWAGVAHQCSCIWLFPHDITGPKEKSQKKSEEAAPRIALALKEKRTKKAPPKALLNQLESKAWQDISPKKSAKLHATGLCIRCGQCVRLCPRGNIQLDGLRPEFGTDCVGCLSCLQYCPQGAITMGGITLSRERYHNPNIKPSELMKDVITVE